MHDFSKIFRILVLIFLVIFCTWLGYVVFLWTYELLDFQLAIYEKVLGTTEYIGNTKESILGFLGADNVSGGDIDIASKLGSYKNKLLWISRGVGAVVAMLCWYISSSIVFGFRRLVLNLREFVG